MSEAPDKIFIHPDIGDKDFIRSWLLSPFNDNSVPYIRKDIVDETVEVAEDHAYFAGKEKLREAILEWAKKHQCEQGSEDGEAEHGYQSAIQDLIKHIESL